MSDTESRRMDPAFVLEDEAMADELVGVSIRPLVLESTEGHVDLAELGAGQLVLFVYPHATGLPEAPVPGWSRVPGARGCTAQSCAFRDEHERIAALRATVAGVSVQSVAEQREFAARVGLNYPLISDPDRQLETALGLPTFTAGSRIFYKRLTLIVRNGLIAKVFFPVRHPERNAADVAEWLERDRQSR